MHRVPAPINLHFEKWVRRVRRAGAPTGAPIWRLFGSPWRLSKNLGPQLLEAPAGRCLAQAWAVGRFFKIFSGQVSRTRARTRPDWAFFQKKTSAQKNDGLTQAPKLVWDQKPRSEPSLGQSGVCASTLAPVFCGASAPIWRGVSIGCAKSVHLLAHPIGASGAGARVF